MEIDLTTRNLTFEELNTQIVRMRKVIKKAKKELIRDLVRKSRRMKASLNKDTVATKRSKKALRMLQDINEIKKSKCDDVAKFLLINELSFNEIAKQGGTEKERALARLSEQTHIKKEIESFRNIFPRWSFQIQSLLNTWKFNAKMMKKKTKKKPKIVPALNKQKNTKVKNEKVEEIDEVTEEIDEEVTEKIDEEVTEENDGKEMEEELEELNEIEMEGNDDINLIQDEAEIVKVQVKKVKSDSIISPAKKTLKVVKASGEKLSLKKTIETFKHSEERVDKSMGEVVVKRFNLDNVESEELKIPSKHKSDSVSTSKPSINMPRSSFFLDMDNNELGMGESDEEEKESRVNKNYEKGSKTSNPKRKSLKPAGFKSNSRSTSKSSKFPNNKNNFNHKETPPAQVELHPSWAAKRNQRQHIFTEVKANKIIKFDD